MIDDFEIREPLELFSGNWKITFSKLKFADGMEFADTLSGGFFVDETSFNPYMKIKAQNDTLLFAAYDHNNPNAALTWGKVGEGVQEARFVYNDMLDPSKHTSTKLPMMMNLSGYSTSDADYVIRKDYSIYHTPEYDSNGNFNSVRQIIEGVGFYPWMSMKVTYLKYDENTHNLLYQISTTLENISYGN